MLSVLTFEAIILVRLVSLLLLLYLQGRHFVVLVNRDGGKRPDMAARDGRRWGWLITFSSAEQQQQDVLTPLQPPRTVFSYIIPHSSETSGQTLVYKYAGYLNVAWTGSYLYRKSRTDVAHRQTHTHPHVHFCT